MRAESGMMMSRLSMAACAAVALALLASPATANWRHHRHDCGWGGHHHKRC